MNVEVQPYFAEGERYPALIGVRAEGDEYETAYVSKSELVDALAENAKLREERREYQTTIDSLVDEWTDHKDENAKLRKLVVEVFKCARRGAACETCKVNNDGYACVYIMRELGIEVPA